MPFLSLVSLVISLLLIVNTGHAESPKRKLIPKETDIYSISEKRQNEIYDDGFKKIKSNHPCNVDIVGKGRRKNYSCYDMIHENLRGPLLVVIPAVKTNKKAYAIGKYELTNYDFAKYCFLSFVCNFKSNSLQEKSFPLVDINVELVEQYAEWLTSRTGNKYRLPTIEEWQHAARTDDNKKREANCRVKVNGKLISGYSIISAKSGKANKWGLKNHIGNVREFVKELDGSISVIGGYHATPYSICGFDFTESHDGKRDSHTGFRLVREL